MADVANHQNSNQNSNQKHTLVIFEGKTSEYFGIWIVNLLLSLVTLGIYSAWAKVRRKKYFYNNTLIENVGFDYHAKPISILKGRLIALALLVVAAINPILQSLVFLIIFIALPWLVVRGSIFNSRNSSHRGLRFDFTGTVGKAVRVFIGLPLLTMITLGLAAPYAAHEKNQFLMSSHRFGLSQFDMKRVVKGFYIVYLKLLIIPILVFLITTFAFYTGFIQNTEFAVPMATNFVDIKQEPKLVLAANEVKESTEDIASDVAESSTDIETATEALPETPSGEEIQEKMSEQEIAVRAEEMEQEDLDGQSISTEQKMPQWQKNKNIWFFVFAYLIFIFGFFGYLQARIGNLVWNSTTLDKLSFKSSLRARDFAWLYFTNIVVIMLTFGLATPWAQIRMARYRASKLQILGDVDFDQFVGDKKAEVKATGEEIAEMFDVDLSFG